MKLVCFGDSWTAGHGVESNLKYKEVAYPDMFTQKLREQNSWPRWLANKIDCSYVNLGVCGFGNHFIYKEVETSIENKFIENDDIIIIMFSYPYRYEKHDIWGVVELFWRTEKLLKDFKHFYFNSFFPTFKLEDFDINNLPKSFINPSNTVSDVLKEYEMKNDVSVWEYGSRSVWNDEKNYWEGDYHPNALGYKIIAEHIYKEIKNEL